MIKNINYSAVRLFKPNAEGELKYVKTYPLTAVRLFIRNRDKFKQAPRKVIAKALRGIRSHVPRTVARDYLGMLKDFNYI
jgi:hypothetical protein